MAVLATQPDRASDEFGRRREHMEALVAELRERTELVAHGGGERALERHRSRGKLTARERVDGLLDPGAAFLELNALAAWDVYDGQAPAAGIVTGIGRVEGRECVIVANDATVGRLLLPAHGQEAPARRRWRCRTACRASTSWTRGGAFLPLQAEVFPTAITSAESSTRRGCPRSASRRSPW